MSETVYLCGFMGCGKTTVGRLLSSMLELPYCDMDDHIEKTLGMSIPDIFEEKGEEYFRRRETEAVSVLGEAGGVISCGGGAMLREVNAQAAKKFGKVVFIDTPFDVCWQRIADDKGRPIVMRNTKESLEVVYDERYPLYKGNCDICVSGEGTPEEIAGRIIELIK